MSMKKFVSLTWLIAVAGLSVSSAQAQITIPTVPIGNPGNAGDPNSTGPIGPVTSYGSVAYEYNIGATEVTNGQYAAFLNAVAAADPHGLYKPAMAGFFGGITRAGSAGSYTYSTITGRANKPVNFVSFWDATRFANWLHNGQPTGAQNNSTTEDGAYTLTTTGMNTNSITRNSGWLWAVTSEDEWYKAAYHQPAVQGGDSDNYWLYPTSSNTAPTTAQASFSNGPLGLVGSFSANFYGTFDMGGNVREWNESSSGGSRIVRGGSFDGFVGNLASNSRASLQAQTWETATGFRIVHIPGPSSVVLLGLSGLLTLRRRR